MGAIAIHPFDDGRAIGGSLACSKTADVVDAHLVSVAIRLAEPILTSHIDELTVLVDSLPDHRPRVLPRP